MPKGIYDHKKGPHRKKHVCPPRPYCRKTDGTAAFNYLFAYYKYNAKRRGKGFDISADDFARIIKQSCFYCGKEPALVVKRGYDTLIINGVDRLDSRKGYAPDNAVACCSRCNMMKGTLSVEEFFAAVREIHNKILASDMAVVDESTLKAKPVIQ